MPTCQACDQEYNIVDSDAEEESLYCSEDCEKKDQEWLAEGNKIMNQAKAENPNLFLRTNMSMEQNQAVSSLQRMGLNFKKEDISRFDPNKEREENA